MSQRKLDLDGVGPLATKYRDGITKELNDLLSQMKGRNKMTTVEAKAIDILKEKLAKKDHEIERLECKLNKFRQMLEASDNRIEDMELGMQAVALINGGQK